MSAQMQAALIAVADKMRRGLHGNLVDVPVSPKLDEWVEDLDRIIAGTLLDASEARLAALTAALDELEQRWRTIARGWRDGLGCGAELSLMLDEHADQLAALRTPEET